MSGAGGASPNKDSRKVILVVDDDASIRNIVARALSPLYLVRQATDGLVAAEELQKPPSVDLVLLDIMMPNADGLTFAKTIKSDPRFKSIPIIFMTAKSQAADVVKGIQAGARAYITKPFKLDDLRQKVAKVLG